MNGKDLWKIYSKEKQKEKQISQCPDINDLAAYIEHKLDEKEKERIEAHLNLCSDCLDSVIEISSIKKGFNPPFQKEVSKIKSSLQPVNNIGKGFPALKLAASVAFALFSAGAYMAGRSTCEISETSALRFLERDLRPLVEIIDTDEKIFYFDPGVVL